MSLRSRLRRLRMLLVTLLATRALLLGAATACLVILLAAGLDALFGMSEPSRRLVIGMAIVTGIATVVSVAWAGRRALRLERVALWVEERVPSLQYSLVTAAELPLPWTDHLSPSATVEIPWGTMKRRAARRALALPSAVLLGAFGALAILPDVVIARVRAPHSGDALDRAALPGMRRNHLSPLVVTLTPPAYSGEALRSMDDPVSVTGLPGSRVVVRGQWSAGAQVEATLGDTVLQVASAGSRWSISLRMPARATVLRLRDGLAERIITVEPRPDRSPTVTLTAPLRDSVMRIASGVLPLRADVTDDIGIASAMFELIVSSGEGESFTFESRAIASVRLPRGQRTLSLGESVALASLDLKPGDIIHLRAVARDANDVSGPGEGSSETRTLRIARAGEYDSVAVEGAPPPNPEEGVISQRMLIRLTEALEKRRPKIGRLVVLSESQAIGRDQRKLRKRVGEIIFTRLGDESHSHDDEEGPEGDMTPAQLLAAADAATNALGTLDFAEGESPVVAINKPLLEAYNAMWEATRELDAGEPARALPPMRIALAAIQRARNAERLYLRGRAPQVVVDLAKVRLQAKERGLATSRVPRSPAAEPERQLARRFAGILTRFDASDAAIVDSLMVLRVDALSDAPPLAAALADVIDALRKGKDATAHLMRARRSLEPAVDIPATTPLWSGW